MIKSGQPLHLPAFKLPASYPTPGPHDPQTIPNDPYDWARRPVLASDRNRYPVYWTLDSIGIHKDVHPVFVRDATTQGWAIQRRPLHQPPRYLIIFDVLGDVHATTAFTNIISAIGTTYLDAKHINVTNWNRIAGDELVHQNSYLDVGVPLHSLTTTTDGVFANESVGVTDPDQTLGGETLVVTGTGTVGNGCYWYQTFGTNATDLVNARQNYVDNWNTFHARSAKFRHVHFLPDSGSWTHLQTLENDFSTPYGTVQAALDETVATVNSPDFYYHVVVPTLDVVKWAFPASAIAAEVVSFFGT